MQLCVIDDLIEQQKTIIRKYPDNREKAIAYLLGFIDCARETQTISAADYKAFKEQITELKPC